MNIKDDGELWQFDWQRWSHSDGDGVRENIGKSFVVAYDLESAILIFKSIYPEVDSSDDGDWIEIVQIIKLTIGDDVGVFWEVP